MIFCFARVSRNRAAAAAARDCKEMTTMGEQQTLSILAWMVGWIRGHYLYSRRRIAPARLGRNSMSERRAWSADTAKRW
jgi:hypothetical protein